MAVLSRDKTLEELYQEVKTAVKEFKSQKEWTEAGYDEFSTWKDQYEAGQRDLYWLCTELLDLALVEETHRPITDSFFIRKNPNILGVKSWKEAIAKQSPIKDRLLLYPRGSFKSSIDRADIVQWIICFKNIRILVMTAEESLARMFVKETKKCFQVPENGPLTRFQMLYWAHCVPSKQRESENEFTTRARNESVSEPTILGLSLGMNTAGKHFDIGKFDDVVSNANSGPRATPEQRKIVTDEIKLTRPLIDGYGYKDIIGTPYDSGDAYTSLKETILGLHIFEKAAWEVKPGAKKKKVEELVEEDVTLLFPKDGQGVERLTFKFLKGEYHSDAFIFSCQYLINPLLTKTVKFTDQMLRKQIIPSEQFPQDGTYFIADVWDLAATDGVKSDRSCGMVGKFTIAGPYAGRCYVCDIVRGRYSKSELPFQIANQANRWKPVRNLGIEKPPAHDFLENDINRALSRVGYGDCPAIEWIPIEHTKGAKNERAAETEILLVNNQIFFSADIPEDVMNEVIKEHVNFKAGANRKDDSVDTLARLARYISKDIKVPQTEQEKQTAAWDLLKQKQLFERQFGLSGSTDQTYSTKFSQSEAKNPGWKTDGYDRQVEATPPLTHWEGLPIKKDFDSELFGL